MGTEATLSLDAENEIIDAINALVRFFAEDDSPHAVWLEVRGNKIGYLNRRDFAVRARTMLGESQPADLTGHPAYSFIKLACPVEGCKTPLKLKIHYDERNPERCDVHTDKILKVVA